MNNKKKMSLKATQKAMYLLNPKSKAVKQEPDNQSSYKYSFSS